jgi:hypothetical protein
MKTRIIPYGCGLLIWPVIILIALGIYKNYVNPALWQTLSQPPFAAVHHRVMNVAGWWEGPAEQWQLEKQSTEESLSHPNLPADVRAEIQRRHDAAVNGLRRGYLIGGLLIAGSYLVIISMVELMLLLRGVLSDRDPAYSG